MFARDKLDAAATPPSNTRTTGNGRNSALKAAFYQAAFFALEKLIVRVEDRELTPLEKEIREKFVMTKEAFAKLKPDLFVVDGYYGHSRDDYTIAEYDAKILSLANLPAPDRDQVFMLADSFAIIAKRRLLKHDPGYDVYFTKNDNEHDGVPTRQKTAEIRPFQPAQKALELIAA